MASMMTAGEIYANFHPQARGTGGLRSVQTNAQQLSEWYRQNAPSLQKIIDGVQSGWQGDAAEAAAQGLAPLVENSYVIGEQLRTAQDLLSRQIGSFHTAAAEVQPVPPAPRLEDAIGAALTGSSPAPIMARIAAQHVLEQANVDAYDKYVGASQYNTTNLPPLADSVTTQAAPVTVVPSRPVTGPGGLSSSVPGRLASTFTGSAPSGTTAGGTPTGRQTVVPQPLSGQSASAPGPVPDATGTQSSPTTFEAAPTTVPMDADAMPSQTPASHGEPGSGLRVVNGIAGEDAVPMPFGSARGDAEPSERDSAARSRAAAVEGRAARSGGEPAEGRGGRSGAEPVERRAAGSGSELERAIEGERNGAATELPPGGALGRGKSGEGDQEHRTKYAVATDGESRFGTDERVAPAVIGDDSDGR
jgi:hypothetical protein